MKRSRGTTPFPNLLIDIFMPRLGDTEWRVLCVVVRQTIGWRGSDGERKTEDWLAHSQLKRRTGRQSEAISRAIQSLIDRGLVVVKDQNGNALGRPSERSQIGKRLYFSLSPGVSGLIHNVSVSGFRNPKATKSNSTKRRRTGGGWQHARDVRQTGFLRRDGQ